jgi:aerobic carbon-monoxide dehydrogenase small subunit
LEASIKTLKVNGKKYRLTFGDDVEPWETPAFDVYPWDTLAWTIREKLHLKGTKLTCGRGACGSCSVIIDKKLALSCLTLTSDCDGKEITTIEGLGTPDNLHPIQEAFIENNAAQCGMCTPGMIMAAKALLDRNPNPTINDIKTGLAGNLCRCGNYNAIAKAVLAAAEKIKRGATSPSVM